MLSDPKASSRGSQDSHDRAQAAEQSPLGEIAKAVQRHIDAGRVQQALNLLDSETSSGGTHWTQLERAYLKLRRAQTMQVRTMLVRRGHTEALAVVADVNCEAERIGDLRLLSDARCLEAWLTINLELGSGRSSEAALAPIGSCLRLRRKLGEGVAEATFLRGLAREHVADATEDDVDEALCLYRESYALAESEGDRRIQSYAAYRMGTIHARRSAFDQALICFEEAYALRSEIGLTVYLPGPRLAIGRTYLAKGDPVKAEEQCREALRLAEGVEHHAFRFFALMGLGDIAKRLGQADKARSQFEQALKAARELEHEEFIDRATRALDVLDS